MNLNINPNSKQLEEIKLWLIDGECQLYMVRSGTFTLINNTQINIIFSGDDYEYSYYIESVSSNELVLNISGDEYIFDKTEG